MEYKSTWKEIYRIGAYDTDFKSRVRLNRLMGYFQEAAWCHAAHLKLGIEFMHQNNVVWVLSAIKIHIEKLPVWREDVVIETWPRNIERVFYKRDFIITDLNKNVFAYGTTNWLLVDLKTKRIKMFETDALKSVLDPEHKVFDDEIEKISPLKDGSIFQREIYSTDIDLNRHLSSNRYADLILDCLPLSFYEEHIITGIQINYIKELLPGQKIKIIMNQVKNDSVFVFEGKSERGEVLHFQAMITFRR